MLTQKLLTILFAIALAIPLASCATTGTGGIDTSPCKAQVAGQEPAWRDLSWSRRDTKETIEEVKANNARHDAWCKG
jgi:hypothetical protein